MKTILSVLFSSWIWFLLALDTIFVTIPILLYTLFLGWLDSRKRLQHRIGILWGCLATRLSPFWQCDIKGLEHFPKKGAFVVISNHSSLIDIVVLYRLNRHFKWLAKDVLFKIPLFGWAMTACGYIALERGRHGSIRDSFEEAHQWLKKEMSVLVFPEGTRSVDRHLGPFHNGAFKLALKARKPILPVLIKGTQELLKKGGWKIPVKARIEVHVLEPIEITPYLPDHFEKLRDHTRTLMASKLSGL